MFVHAMSVCIHCACITLRKQLLFQYYPFLEVFLLRGSATWLDLYNWLITIVQISTQGEPLTFLVLSYTLFYHLNLV